MKARSEFDIIKEFEYILNLKNETDGTLFEFDRKYKNRKPDGVFRYKNIIIVLDAKAEGKKFTNQIRDYLTAMKEANPEKQVIGIQYNGVSYHCFINSCDNQVNNHNWPANKDYYYNLVNNKEIDKSVIFNLTYSINSSLERLGISSLLKRIVWTACVLVVAKDNPLNNFNQSYKNDIVQFLRKSITNTMKKNLKIQILIEEFQKIDINDNPDVLKSALKNVEQISSYLNSSDWNGEDVASIFFNEFTRYKGKAQEGQVFTPEIWTEFMYKILKINYKDRVLDAACGSGGFLVKAMNLMIKERPEDQENIKEKRLFGVENSRDLFAVTAANMLLHKDGQTNLQLGDSTTKDIGKWIKKSKISKVLMNPPFEKAVGINILKNVLDNVEDNALVAFILPDYTFYTKSKTTIKYILRRNRIEKIIKMPLKTWSGLASVETSIFIFKKGIAHDNFDIPKYWIKEDGLQTVKNSGRHDVNKVWKNTLSNEWISIINDDANHTTKQLDKNLAYIVSKEDTLLYEEDFDETILNRLTYENPNWKKKKVKKEISKENRKYFKLGCLFDICNQKGYKKSELDKNGDTPYISRTSKNNGVSCYVRNKPEVKENVITIHSEWSDTWIPFFQDKPFITDGHISILTIKSEFKKHFNKEIALYFCTVISNSCVDYTIKTKIERVSNTEISLPIVNDNEINWELMKNYISEKIKLYEELQ